MAAPRRKPLPPASLPPLLSPRLSTPRTSTAARYMPPVSPPVPEEHLPRAVFAPDPFPVSHAKDIMGGREQFPVENEWNVRPRAPARYSYEKGPVTVVRQRYAPDEYDEENLALVGAKEDDGDIGLYSPASPPPRPGSGAHDPKKWNKVRQIEIEAGLFEPGREFGQFVRAEEDGTTNSARYRNLVERDREQWGRERREALVRAGPPSQRRMWFRVVELLASVLGFVMIAGAGTITGKEYPLASKEPLYILICVSLFSIAVTTCFLVIYCLRRYKGREKLSRWIYTGLDFLAVLFWRVTLYWLILGSASCPSDGGSWCYCYDTSLGFGCMVLLMSLISFGFDITGGCCMEERARKKALKEGGVPGSSLYSHGSQARMEYLMAMPAIPMMSRGPSYQVVPMAYPGTCIGLHLTTRPCTHDLYAVFRPLKPRDPTTLYPLPPMSRLKHGESFASEASFQSAVTHQSSTSETSNVDADTPHASPSLREEETEYEWPEIVTPVAERERPQMPPSEDSMESTPTLRPTVRQQSSTPAPSHSASGSASSSRSTPARTQGDVERAPSVESTASNHTIRRRNPMSRRTTQRLVSHGSHYGHFSAEDDEMEVMAALERQRSHESRRVGGVSRRSIRGMRSYTGSSLRAGITDEEPDADDMDNDAADAIGLQEEVVDEIPEIEMEQGELSDTGSDASFTLKDRQNAINKTHPFGIRIWKPAIYKKIRSVQARAEGDIHSAPGLRHRFSIFNILWTLFFGWWLAIICMVASISCYLLCFSRSGVRYGKVFWGLARYLMFPFGRFVDLEPDEAYAEEDEGEGQSISEFERYGWDRDIDDLENGHREPGARSIIGRHRDSFESTSETDSLLRAHRNRRRRRSEAQVRGQRRMFGRGKWSLGRIVFYLWFYILIAPLLLLVSMVCWMGVFTIPMSKVTYLLFAHLRRHPLSLSFHSDLGEVGKPGSPSASVLVCTYNAVGLGYYKYTVDGTNIFFVNLMFVVFFTIVDDYFIGPWSGHSTWVSSPAVIFSLALVSVIPLAYFVGQAVASISAQSSMGMGAAINAFFGSLVEIFLYCVALNQGKAQITEGSIVGSVLAGVLLMPGTSMCAGALRRKTQRFNAKSAGVTSTMLLFAVVAAFAPTLFYQIYGTYELKCGPCKHKNLDCQRCFFDQSDALSDPFYQHSVKPFTYLCAVCLVLSYAIGLWFTLRTHAKQIWQMPIEGERRGDHMRDSIITLPPAPQDGGHSHGDRPHATRSTSFIRDSAVYKRAMPAIQSLLSPYRHAVEGDLSGDASGSSPRASGEVNGERRPSLIQGLSPEDNLNLARNVAEVAATAAALTIHTQQQSGTHHRPSPARHQTRPTSYSYGNALDDFPEDAEPGHGGHDAPNWSKTKSAVILLSATILYAIIAEILVDTVDVVLEHVRIDEKFLGFTLFALVPNTTEFLNAISFAVNGNAALSMEIGSAYALQVCLLQIPALVAYSAFTNYGRIESASSTFSLIFPRWDLVCVILSVFLLSYVHGEGKSNYFKGSILVLGYVVMSFGFYATPSDAHSYGPFEILRGPAILMQGGGGEP
ncbi:hypothetical protein G7K_0399-t1 [Saitoella complicata NRRL Y-17804]|uniref:Uncharacterized protein n=1 Tax=Saitoella complicata (strain BCRC 22490 / CBS 7301 / JCM 7358 / NBRC 10748 / NRRL Y-17804) TaxID=698492 RepID=A0A0E9N8C8_SAICN|nr:hypothetical protein G7K_0399-t1 [Saitoella complicata NRRL Y-17804]